MNYGQLTLDQVIQLIGLAKLWQIKSDFYNGQIIREGKTKEEFSASIEELQEEGYAGHPVTVKAGSADANGRLMNNAKSMSFSIPSSNSSNTIIEVIPGSGISGLKQPFQQHQQFQQNQLVPQQQNITEIVATAVSGAIAGIQNTYEKKLAELEIEQRKRMMEFEIKQAKKELAEMAEQLTKREHEILEREKEVDEKREAGIGRISDVAKKVFKVGIDYFMDEFDTKKDKELSGVKTKIIDDDDDTDFSEHEEIKPKEKEVSGTPKQPAQKVCPECLEPFENENPDVKLCAACQKN